MEKKYHRRDGNPARLAAVEAATKEMIEKYFSDSPNWWSLELLVTDRAYRRHGAATMLVRWGTDRADEEDVFCGVEASVMGSPLYEALGFRPLEKKVVHVPGDSDSLPYDVMRRDPEPTETADLPENHTNVTMSEIPLDWSKLSGILLE
jgi:GNAT superfamily N-acetyltransferase